MCHDGFYYKEGINIGTEPFDDRPMCGGGLFFSDAKNILECCGYGNLIAEVEVPEDEHVVQVDRKYKAHRIILKNIRPLWNVETFKELIEEGTDIHANDNALRYAAAYGHLDVVKYLVKCGANIHTDNNGVLRCAVANGHLDVVKYLIDCGADVHTGSVDLLSLADEFGCLDIVKYLKNL